VSHMPFASSAGSSMLCCSQRDVQRHLLPDPIIHYPGQTAVKCWWITTCLRWSGSYEKTPFSLTHTSLTPNLELRCFEVACLVHTPLPAAFAYLYTADRLVAPSSLTKDDA